MYSSELTVFLEIFFCISHSIIRIFNNVFLPCSTCSIYNYKPNESMNKNIKLKRINCYTIQSMPAINTLILVASNANESEAKKLVENH